MLCNVLIKHLEHEGKVNYLVTLCSYTTCNVSKCLAICYQHQIWLQHEVALLIEDSDRISYLDKNVRMMKLNDLYSLFEFD